MRQALPIALTASVVCVVALYAVLLGTPTKQRIVIADRALLDGASMTLLGNDTALDWGSQGDHCVVTLPRTLADAPAHARHIA